MKILSSEEIRKVERNYFARYGTEAELMLKAGTACFNSMVNRYGSELVGTSVSVLCGNGKNAGDGFVIAALLYNYGCNAVIVLCDREPEIAEPLLYYRRAVDSGVKSVHYERSVLDCDYLVDCMFGIGFHGEPRAPFDRIFEDIAACGARVISVDTPSGTDATTGEVCVNGLSAELTIAVSTLKYAHILPPANAHCGDIDVVNIGIPDDCYGDGYANTIEPQDIRLALPRRDINANKGSCGRLLTLCGSYAMPGAAVFCAEGGIRSGAGLVKVTAPSVAYPLIECHTCQPVFNPVRENDEGTFSALCTNEVKRDLQWADSTVIGCGIGVNDDTCLLTRFVLQNAQSPVILDADGINCMISSIDILKEIKVPVVLTPHPGEMARLMSDTVAGIQHDRIGKAVKLARRFGIVVVLKGANTVVTDGENVFVNTTGNPGMAMGGTGDMLSGMIGSLIAQGVPPFEAAKTAVHIHGLCGDRAMSKYGMRGYTVFDMIDQLGALMSDYE